MKRLALPAVIAAALLVPFASSAQSPDPAASPDAAASPMAAASPATAAETMGPIGVGSQHVCLEISGPITLLTAETLTQGIMDGTFTIVGLSDQCAATIGADASPAAGVGASPAASPMIGVTASPEASPMAGTAAASPAS